MAGDWIKMRSNLCTHPKVLMIAEIIGESTDVGRRLSTGFNGCLNEIVTSDVTRDVTLAALLRVWCATNEHTDDGIWRNSTLRTIDQAAGIPGFGAAMVEAGWAIYDEKARTVELPNFLENNAPAKDNARSTGAERQARYREKQRAAQSVRDESSVTGDVTRDVTMSVTSDTREEKRREEEKDIGSNSALGESNEIAHANSETRAVDLSVAMRSCGIQSNPSDPRLQALADQGVTAETVLAAAEEAKRTKPNERISPAYVVAIVQRWADDAARISAAGAQAPMRAPAAGQNRQEALEARNRSIALELAQEAAHASH